MDDCLGTQINSSEYAVYWWKSTSQHSNTKFTTICHLWNGELKPWHSDSLLILQRDTGGKNARGYQSFHSCELEHPEWLPCKWKQVIKKGHEKWKNDKVFTGLKISSSFQRTYQSWCPRPYLTSELKYSQPFTPTWNRAIKVILDKCIHEVWSAWTEKRAVRKPCQRHLRGDDVIDDD